MVSYFLHLWDHGVVVGDGLLPLALNLVGKLACLDEFLHARLYNLSTLGNFLYNLHVACRQLLALVRTEDIHHALNVLGQPALVVCGYGNDMVH